MSHSSLEESAWREEFEKAGEQAIRDSYNHDHAIRTGGERRVRFVRQWLREKENERERRSAEAICYTKGTFWAAVVAVAVGIIGIGLTIYFAR